MAIAVIDYGSGNLRSAAKALERAAAERGAAQEIIVTADAEVVRRADRLVLPGVGAFAACMRALEAIDGLHEAIEEAVIRKGRPFLGVCVGMQLLATRGLEFGESVGLDWIEGEVRKLEPDDPHAKIPHMGWNSLSGVSDLSVLADVKEGRSVYFTHSFALYPRDNSDVAAWVDHGGRFPAAVARGNVAGVQFHPEKSQDAGLSLLARFLEWRP